MICSNCGQETSGNFCQWCGYPLMGSRPVKKQAQREAKEAKEQTQKEAEAAVQVKAKKEAKEKAKKEVKKAKGRAREAKLAEEEVEEEVGPAVMAKLYKGMVELTVMPPIDLVQLENLEKALRQVENLRLVLVGGSAGKGSRIVVSAEEPIPLLGILREMPAVGGVVRRGGEIQVTLKAK